MTDGWIIANVLKSDIYHQTKCQQEHERETKHTSEQTNERYDKEIEFNKKRSLAVLIFERTKESVGVFPFSCGAQLCFVCARKCSSVCVHTWLFFACFCHSCSLLSEILSCFHFFPFLFFVCPFGVLDSRTSAALSRVFFYVYVALVFSFGQSVYDDCSILFVHHFLCWWSFVYKTCLSIFWHCQKYKFFITKHATKQLAFVIHSKWWYDFIDGVLLHDWTENIQRFMFDLIECDRFYTVCHFAAQSRGKYISIVCFGWCFDR